MKKLFGWMFAAYCALLTMAAHAQAMDQGMADRLNAMNDDQNVFVVIWYLIAENWLLILAALILLVVVLMMMRRHDRKKAELAAAKSTGDSGENKPENKPDETKEEK